MSFNKRNYTKFWNGSPFGEALEVGEG